LGQKAIQIWHPLQAPWSISIYPFAPVFVFPEIM
jgi:hypothetical protein